MIDLLISVCAPSGTLELELPTSKRPNCQTVDKSSIEYYYCKYQRKNSIHHLIKKSNLAKT
jgi:hypothetical protein